jgi:DNA-binding IclR family transcriptional regulator
MGVDSALAKAFGVLEALSRAKGPSRLSALAAELGLQKSTVHRILGELTALGYVERDGGTGLYRPTLRTWELGTTVVADLPIKQVASGALHRLHERTGETVSLVVRSGDDALYLDKLVSARPIRFTTRVGSRLPLPLTAGGKALLAASADGEEVLRRVAARRDLAHHLDVDRALEELATIRRRGYAIATGVPGLVGVAAAVVDRDDEPVAALSVSAPADRLPPSKQPEVVEAVLGTAAHLAESIGRL